MKAKFIHLRLHSEYSVVDGLIKVKPLMKALVERNMPAVALTDQSNLFAAVKFYRFAVGLGIKPIIGCDVYLNNETDPGNLFKLVLLCKNNIGYSNLRKIISKSYIEGQSQGKALVKQQWLEEYAEGLILLSGATEGDVGQAILAGKLSLAEERLARWLVHFPNHYYLEIQRIGRPQENQYNEQMLELAQAQQVPVVATNDVRFLSESDFEAHEARVCIHEGYALIDPKRPKRYTNKQYLTSENEMLNLFSDLPQALGNSVAIAQRCSVTMQFDEYFLPNFPVPRGMTMDEFFAKEAQTGLEKRLAILYDVESCDFAEIRKPYDERLAVELGVINSMGFAGYFLIVADFIRWAKQNAVPVGPGRGSGAGSIVAYALGITDLDPLEYDLLFERFLNPERVSMPDFDVDFCMDGRDRVIEYVAEKYGRDSVSQIITYGTMAAKAVVRDVGRVLSHPYGFVDAIAKLIPFEIGMTLDKALAQEEAFLERYKTEDEVRELIDLAKKLEGTVRNAGKHAGGVVIAPSELTNFTPLYCEENGGSIVTQFDKDDVETIGLVKFDFLGLRTLTIIQWAMNTINAMQTHAEPLDINLIPVNDSKTFALLKECNTTAVFQLESRGMKDLIRRLQPDCFEDIIALVALFRPGPLQSGMVDDFIDRKHGRAVVEYPHPALESILCSTYGVILYQEQVMQIAQELAGYTLGGADVLRRAMGKKKPEEMAKQRKIFTQGSVARGVEEKTATLIFDLMEKFAGYGFNKSHSAAYALVSYQTAWLKTHYPAEFMAAVLSSDMDNTDKVVNFYDDCMMQKLTVLPPAINQGQYKFTVNQAREIIYGLGAVKGVGEGVIDLIVTEREAHGSYSDFFEFCRRVDTKKVNKRVFEALIRSGTFDSFGKHRASLMASLPTALKFVEQQGRNTVLGQSDLFGMSETQEDNYAQIDPWSDTVRLTGEKETLGIYLTGHPLDRYEDELRHFATAPIGKLTVDFDRQVVIVGFITSIRTIFTKKGDRMAFIALSDKSGKLEAAVFSDVFQSARELLVKGQLVVVEGDITADDYSGGFKMACSNVMNIEQAREHYARRIKVTVNQKNLPDLDVLKEHLNPFAEGVCPLLIEYIKDTAKANLQLGTKWRVTPSDELLDNLRAVCGHETVSVEY